MSRWLLVLLCGCAAPDYPNPDLFYHGRPGPHEKAVRDQEYGLLAQDRQQRVKMDLMRVHRHRLATNQVAVMPPIPR